MNFKNMKSNFQNNLLLLNDEEIIRNIAEDFYTPENVVFAYEVLIDRKVKNIEEKIIKIRNEKTIKINEKAESEKKINKIFSVTVVIVICTVANQLTNSYKFAKESNIFLSLTFIMLGGFKHEVQL